MFIETGVNELNTLYRSTGLTNGQVYRVINSGNLEPNALTVKFGDFVRWDGSKWGKSATQLATTAIFDDGDEVGRNLDVDGRAYYDSHEVGKFYFEDGTLCKCYNKTREGEPGSYTYTTQMSKMNGIVEVVNDIVDRIVELENRIATLEAGE